MCRSSEEGGRRCDGATSKSATSNALRQRRSRATRALAKAEEQGDAEAANEARARLAQINADATATEDHPVTSEPKPDAEHGGDVTPPSARTQRRDRPHGGTDRDVTSDRQESGHGTQQHPREGEIRMSNHPDCDRLRLVDRCIQCNPGYSDKNQAYSIYKETKRGKSLAEAERSDVKKRRR